MDHNIHSLDQLFSMAKSEEPKISFEQAQRMFVLSAAAQIGTVGVSSLLSKLINLIKNPFIMLGTTGIVISSIVLMMNTTPKESSAIIPVNEFTESDDYSINKDVTPKSSMFSEIVKAIESDDQELDTMGDGENLSERIEKSQKMKKDDIAKTIESNSQNYVGYSSRGLIKEDETIKETVFRITDETTKEEIEQIKSLAESAGVMFSYKMNSGNNRVKKIKMELKESGAAEKSSMMFGGDFDVELGWVSDASGKAVNFYVPESERVEDLIGEAMEDLDLLFDKEYEKLDLLILEENVELFENTLEKLELEHEIRALQLESLFHEDLALAQSMVNSILERNVDVQLIIKPKDEEIDKVEENYKRISYLITESTTKEELEQIQKEALKAGINVSHASKFRKNKLLKLDLYLKILRDNGEQFSSQVFVKRGAKESFSITVKWRIDEEGNAVDFDGNRCQSVR